MTPFLLAALAAVGPAGPGPEPLPEPTSSGTAGSVAVVFHPEATVSPAVRQQAIVAIAEQLGVSPEAIVEQPVLAARHAVAHRVSRAAVADASVLAGDLDRAAAEHRSGRSSIARETAARVLAGLAARPDLPAAPGLAFRAHLLLAQISWSEGDDKGVDQSLRAAIALDPEADVSKRRVPPGLVEQHRRLRGVLDSERGRWPQLAIEAEPAGAIEVEVDGRPAGDAVPPGQHFVVVRRGGVAAVAVSADAREPIAVRFAEEEIPDAIPDRRERAEPVCAALGLSRIVAVAVSEDRLAMQTYACGTGFAPAVFADDLDPEAIVARALRPARGRSLDVWALSGRWPAPDRRIAGPGGPRDDGPDPKPKPWFRRAWIWVVVGVVVAGAVTTGVVLGTRDQGGGVEIDAETFLRPDLD